MEWVDALNRALAYIEANLESDLSVATIARAAQYSSFTLQRAFAMLTDVPLAEYVRRRRMSAAGQALRAGATVTETAYRFGYETPESFQKAFRRFHGVTPSAARREHAPLHFFSPLTLQISLTGGTMMDYRVEQAEEIWVMGMERRFQFDRSFSEVPEFWSEYGRKGLHDVIPGIIGVCVDNEGSDAFTYIIGCFAGPGDAVPEGFTLRSLGTHEWIKFHAVGPMPEAIQKVNRQVYTQWLPSSTEYELAADVNIEVYSKGDMSSADYTSELWLPVRRKSARVK